MTGSGPAGETTFADIRQRLTNVVRQINDTAATALLTARAVEADRTPPDAAAGADTGAQGG